MDKDTKPKCDHIIIVDSENDGVIESHCTRCGKMFSVKMDDSPPKAHQCACSHDLAYHGFGNCSQCKCEYFKGEFDFKPNAISIYPSDG